MRPFLPIAALLAALAVAGPATGQGAARDIDSLDRRIERGPPAGRTPPIDSAETPALRQDLRDARRRANEARGTGAGYDRARLRALERSRADQTRRENPPALGGGMRRSGGGGARLLDRSVPETDLDLDDLETGRSGRSGEVRDFYGNPIE